MKNEDIKTLLKDIGLSVREVEVYLAVVSIGPARVSVIAKQVRMQRQTAYSILRALSEKGVLKQSDLGAVKRFSADPRELLLYLDQKQESLKNTKIKLQKQIPKLLDERKSHTNIPKVTYYEGDSGLKLLFQHMLSFYKEGGEKLFRAYGINNFHGVLGGYLYDFVQERNRYDVETKLFIGDGSDDFGIVDKGSTLGREVKRLNMESQEAGVYILGDKLFLFSYKDEVGIMIENNSIVSLFKAVFDDHWERVSM